MHTYMQSTAMDELRGDSDLTSTCQSATIAILSGHFPDSDLANLLTRLFWSRVANNF
jgi:hypothetical protein